MTTRLELSHVIAQLRHAYTHLNAERVKDQKEFANGLISPQIERLEKIANEMDQGDQRSSAATGAAHGTFFHVTQEEKDTCEICERQRRAEPQEAPIYQTMETSDDHNGMTKDLWMDVPQAVYEDLRHRDGIRSRIVYAASPVTRPESKTPDRSRHMGWDIGDVEHHKK